MLKIKSFGKGEKVGGGIYWNPKAWDAQVVPREGAALEGEDGAAFIRVPAPLMLIAAPLLGAVFAMFLPFLGFAMLGTYVARRAKGVWMTARHGHVTR